MAKNASGSITLRTTEQDTSPSFHWSPARPVAIARCPPRITDRPRIRSHDREFILCGMADDPTCPGANPSVASSCPAIRRRVVARLAGPAATCTRAATTSRSNDRG